MERDAVSINVEILTPEHSVFNVNSIANRNYIYTRIHTIDRKAILLKKVLDICKWSFNMMYESSFDLDHQAVAIDIENLLIKNHYPSGSVEVILHLIPSEKDVCGSGSNERFWMLSCGRQLLYRGYTWWHTKVKAQIIQYDIPFSFHQTAASLTTHKYAEGYAQKSDAQIVIREDKNDILISASEYPLFGVKDNTLYTTPINVGLSDSLERDLTIVCAKKLDIKISEVPLKREDIWSYEELFYVTSQGVHSISECEGTPFPSNIGRNIGEAMQECCHSLLTPIPRNTTL